MIFLVHDSGNTTQLNNVTPDQAAYVVEMYPKIHIYQGE